MRYLNFAMRLLLMILLLLAGASASSARSPQQSPAYKLQRMARTRFRKISECETRLLKAVPTGHFAYCGPSQSKSDPVPCAEGSANRTDNLRAELIRWLSVDPVASKLVDPKGIQVQSAYLPDALDLSFVAVPFPLSFKNSFFVEKLHLNSSALINFDASGGHFLHGIDARRVTDSNEFTLTNVTSEDEVDLTGGNIGGDLKCEGSTLRSRTGIALEAYALKVGGDVFLESASNSQKKFSADGEVHLTAANIGSSLHCDGGTFKNHGKTALDAYALKVGGDMFLGDGFNADGEVKLTTANIGSDLHCEGGTFNNPPTKKNPDAIALGAYGLKVGGQMLVSDGFDADGEVKLTAANIGSSLDCKGGTIKSHGATALDAYALKVGGDVFLSDGFNADGEVKLTAANIGSDLYCDGGTFNNPPTKKNPRTFALDAYDLKVGGDVFLRDWADNQGKVTPFVAEGEVNLEAANIGSNLYCNGGTFKNPKGTALDAKVIKVDRDVYFSDGDGNYPFEVDGKLDLTGAEIKGELLVPAKSIAHVADLDLREASTVDFNDGADKSWPQKDKLKLDGFVYNHFARSTKDAQKRIEWVQHQGNTNFATQPYEQLAKVLREEGDEAGARTVLIKMNVDQFWEGKLGFWQCCKSAILWAMIGYGYAPWRALWWIGGLLVLGFLRFRRGIRQGWIISTEEHPERYKPFSPLIYSLETLLPLVDLYQSKHWIPDANTPGGRNLRRYLWFHTLAGWFFASMLIAGVTGLVQK